MEEEQTAERTKIIKRNPYDISSDEDEDTALQEVPALLQQLKLLTLLKK